MEQHMYFDVSKDLAQKRRELAPDIFYRWLSTADVLAAEQSAMRDRRAYRRAIERWENEGGATLA